jgi:hypothetical protein
MLGFALIDFVLLAFLFWQLYELKRERGKVDRDRGPKE